MTAFRGLTWDHPRGYAALDRAAREAGAIVSWDRQPLEGFESAPIAEVCAGYDLVVLDHPHLGDALAAGCLQPLDALLPETVLASIRAQTLGPCFDSYVMGTHLWALPLDAAAQVSVARPELLATDMPATFGDLDRLASTEPGFVLSLAGPHAFLTLLSLCASLDDRFGPPEDAYFLPHHEPSIELFTSLARRSATIGWTHNPIALLEALARGEVSYCPLVFGYVTYAERRRRPALVFRDAPGMRAGAPPRAVLGGTGVALTRNCQPTTDLLAHLEALMSASVQNGLMAETGGQPSAESAWLSPEINEGVNGFYRETLETLRHAFLRPRHRGFVATQNAASAWLGTEPASRASAASVRTSLNAILRKAFD